MIRIHSDQDSLFAKEDRIRRQLQLVRKRRVDMVERELSSVEELERLEREEEERIAAQAGPPGSSSSEPLGDAPGLISDADWAAVLGSSSWDQAVLDSGDETGQQAAGSPQGSW